MPYDRALILLLLGMLVYRSIDLGATHAKLEQALSRARRQVRLWPEGTRPHLFFPAYRQHASRIRPREFQTLVIWYRAASVISREFHFILMGSCILILLLLGLSLIATHADRSESTGHAILAVTTLAVSWSISAVTLLLERFRLRLEKV